MAPYKYHIDNYKLISEVKIRPALYNTSVREYNDSALKKTLWTEISSIVIPKWDKLSDVDKELATKAALSRWNNLRGCFRREVRLLKSNKPKRRKYIYFKQLQFLRPKLKSEIKSKNEGDCEEGSNDEEKDEEENDGAEPPTDQEDDTDGDEHDYINNETYNEAKQHDDTEMFFTVSVEDKNQKDPINDCRSIDKKESKDKDFQSIDQDTNFAMSIVPMLKRLPLPKKLDAQIDILRVFKKYFPDDSNEASVSNYRKRDFKASPKSYDDDDSSEILELFTT